MLDIDKLRNVLVLDIETVSAESDYSKMPERLKPLWDKKASFIRTEDEKTPEELYFDRAAIFAEFGKIVTIAVGIFHGTSLDDLEFRVKAFASHDEKKILEAFKDLVGKKLDPFRVTLCAHNGKEFDYPYICRRMLINGIGLPHCLDISGKKPWEVNHWDTLELWKFGDRKSFTSLELLAAIFNVPSSKSDIDGSQVNHAYYVLEDLDRIAHYCKQDVVVTGQLTLRLHGMPLIPEQRIRWID